jgi:hypothetical protein
MKRTPRSYASAEQPARKFAGLDVERPQEGFYRFKLRSGGVYGVVRIWYGAPLDPQTGEEMDRSWRWQAAFNGELIEFEQAWPQCAKMPCTEADYRHAIRRQEWAKKHAPDSAFADHRTRIDPLSSSTPLPF